MNKVRRSRSWSRSSRSQIKRMIDQRMSFEPAPAPHLFFGERVGGSARLGLGERLEDRIRENQVLARRDLNVGRRAIHDVHRMAGGFDQLSVVGNVLAQFPALGIRIDKPLAAENLRRL